MTTQFPLTMAVWCSPKNLGIKILFPKVSMYRTTIFLWLCLGFFFWHLNNCKHKYFLHCHKNTLIFFFYYLSIKHHTYHNFHHNSWCSLLSVCSFPGACGMLSVDFVLPSVSGFREKDPSMTTISSSGSGCTCISSMSERSGRFSAWTSGFFTFGFLRSAFFFFFFSETSQSSKHDLLLYHWILNSYNHQHLKGYHQ